MTFRWRRPKIEFKPRDMWVGIYLRRSGNWGWHAWVCVLPMLPVHFYWETKA